MTLESFCFLVVFCIHILKALKAKPWTDGKKKISTSCIVCWLSGRSVELNLQHFWPVNWQLTQHSVAASGKLAKEFDALIILVWFILSANTKTNELSVVVACQFSCSHSQRLLKSERFEGQSKWICEDAMEDVKLDLTFVVPFQNFSNITAWIFQSLTLHLGDDALPSDLLSFALPDQLKICLIVFLSLPPAFGFLPSSSPPLPLPPLAVFMCLFILSCSSAGINIVHCLRINKQE